MDSLTNTPDHTLRRRAQKVIPGGMWGHQHVDRLPKGYPQFFSRAEGCRLWDVNGREYIDYLCGWGPTILGNRDPDVDAAAARQAERSDCLNGPGEPLVELAELFVETIPHADWAIFAKNGTDATTTCVTIARATTRRRKVLVARNAYHGAVPWCSPSVSGVTEEDRAHLIYYNYNDLESLHAAVESAGDDLAGVLVSAFKHDMGVDQELPTAEFARLARDLTRQHDAALIVDDVRAGLRLDLGGSWEPLGIRPDLSAWSKGIANGYALAAITGTDAYRAGAASIFTTGSFWTASVSMAASIATLQKLHRLGAVETMTRMGQRLREGIQSQADKYGIAIRQSGPVQMPLILFDDPDGKGLGNAFCVELLERGVYFHPEHTMFLSLAHDRAAIDLTLQATDDAFAALARL